MLIIIEGNEGVGKTTLINQMEEKIPFIRVKYPKEIKDTYLVLDSFAMSNQIFVLDRSFISDIVYRTLDHQKGQMNLFQIGRLTGRTNDIKIVFCHNENGFLNAITRGENNITTESKYKIIENGFYVIEELMKCFTDIEIFDYDYEYDSVDDVIEFIKGGNKV